MPLINGNALQIPLADCSVHCVVTSPPYWGLRDYGTARWEGGDPECGHKPGSQSRVGVSGLQGGKGTSGHQQEGYRDICGKCGAVRIDNQLGLEPTPDAYVANMVAVFREVRRVLRTDGVVFLNLGDSYATSPAGNKTWGSGVWANKHYQEHGIHQTAKKSFGNLKPKDLCMIPARVALALQADGWYLRSKITWCKTSPMPESVTDRPTSATEEVFLLAKSARYFYDHEAVKVPSVSGHSSGNGYKRDARLSYQGANGARGSDDEWEQTDKRNLWNYWVLNSESYSGAHFATFPPALVEPCVKAGTSERGVCPVCGKPWVRVVEKTGHVNRREPAHVPGNTGTKVDSTGWAPTTVATNRWRPTCDHDAEPVPALVLDPFCGSGTVGEVCRGLRRRFVGLDLSAEYLARNAMPRSELKTCQAAIAELPMFAEMGGQR